MLPREHKLNRVTFPKYKDPKKSWTGISLRIQYTYTNSSDPAQYAVVVPKKICALSVGRNELKRSIYHKIEQYGEKLLSEKGMKVVIFPLKKEGTISPAAIEKDIQDFISELK